jgi:short-subunit dehydrogenase
MFVEIKKRFGRLDLCVPNAGEATLACATETSLEQWNRDIETNLTGLYITSIEALKIMKKQNSGNIIAIVSKAGKSAFFLRAAYCASKWGALGFLKCLALEAKNYDVKVTALCPASVATDFQKDNPAGMDWMMPAETVAESVEYILSLDKNSYIDEIVLSTWKK